MIRRGWFPGLLVEGMHPLMSLIGSFSKSFVAVSLIVTSISPVPTLAQGEALWDRMADQVVCDSHAAMAAGNPERSAMRDAQARHRAASQALAEEIRRLASAGSAVSVTRPEERPALPALLNAASAEDGVFDATIHLLGRSSAVVDEALMREFGSFHLAAAAAHLRAYERYGCSDMIEGG